MRSQQFIDELYKVGWQATGDAQHTRILDLWERIFPGSAELEKELREIMEHGVESHEDAYDMQEIARCCLEWKDKSR